ISIWGLRTRVTMDDPNQNNAAEEVFHKLRAFSLSNIENAVIDIGDDDVKASIDECRHSLFGKIVGEKRAHLRGIKKAMGCPANEGRLVRELGINFFQFIFENQEDMLKVANGTNWIFENQFLILRKWKEGLRSTDKSFNELNLWVQIHNVPLNWLTSEVGLKIGKIFKSISNVLISNLGSQGGRLIKLLVTVDITEALPRCTTIRLGSQAVTVTFKYERLVNLCFYYGKIGHIEKGCNQRIEDISANTLKEGQFGEWMRATDGLQGQGWNNANSSTDKAKDSDTPQSNTRQPSTSQNPITNASQEQVGSSKRQENAVQVTESNFSKEKTAEPMEHTDQQALVMVPIHYLNSSEHGKITQQQMEEEKAEAIT
ncbi:Unknown protein, partial [Striga hermonthica]